MLRRYLFGFLALSLGLAAASLISACSQTEVATALASPSGQLFCAIQTNGGGTVVAGLIDGAATAANPTGGQIAVIATGAAKADVDAECAAAKGIPVSPPANPTTAPQVAIIVPPPLAATPAAAAPASAS